MPPGQSLISNYLMCSFVLSLLLFNLVRSLTILDNICYKTRSKWWYNFEDVEPWFGEIGLDLKSFSNNESIIMKIQWNKAKETTFFVGKTRWWFFHIVNALKATFIVWTLKVRISCSWKIWISNWLMTFFIKIFACIANLFELRYKNEILTCLNVIKWNRKSKGWELKLLK